MYGRHLIPLQYSSKLDNVAIGNADFTIMLLFFQFFVVCFNLLYYLFWFFLARLGAFGEFSVASGVRGAE